MPRLLVALLMLVALPWTTAVAEPRPFAHEQSDLKPDPAITWGKLPNGLRYVVWPLAGHDQVSLRLLVEAGSGIEEPDQRGLAHFLEHMLFKGTQNLPQADLAAYLQRLGLRFGADANASTGADSTIYKLDLPRAEPELIDRGLVVLREFADRALLSPEQIEPERGVIAAERRLRDTAGYRQWIAASGLLFGDDWPARIAPIGDPAVIARVNHDDFERFYRRWYRPDHMVVIVTGKVDAPAITAEITTLFGDLKGIDTPLPETTPPTTRPAGLQVRHLPEQDTNVSVELLTARNFDPGPDSAAVRAERMPLALAHRIISQRLGERARAEGGKYDVGGVSFTDSYRSVRTGGIALSTDPSSWRLALAAADQELRRALAHGFTAVEIDEARDAELKAMAQRIAAAADRRPAGIADRLVSAVRYDSVPTALADDQQRLEAVLARIDNASLMAALHGFWDGDDRRIMITGPLGVPDDQADAAMRAAWADTQAVAVAAPAEAALPPFAYRDFGPPGRIVARSAPAPAVTEARFANGLRTIIMQTDGKSGRLRVALQLARDPARRDTDPEMVGPMAGSMLVYGGLEAHPFDALRRYLQRYDVGFGVSALDSELRFSSQPAPDDLGFALDLTAAYLTAPAFRPQGFELTRTDLDRTYRAMAGSADLTLGYRLPRHFYDNAPGIGLPPETVFDAARPEPIVAWLKGILKSAPATLVIVGKIEPDVALAEVARTLGALPDRPAASDKLPATVTLAVAAPGREPPLTFRAADQRGYAALAWPAATGAERDAQALRRQQILAEVFRLRLREALRSEDGASYSPGVRSTVRRDIVPAQITAVVDCRPNQVETVIDRTRGVAASFAITPIAEDEFTRALEPLVAAAAKAQTEDSDRFSVLTTYPDPAYATARLADWTASLRRVTREEVQALAVEALKPDLARVYTILPETTN